VLPQKIPFLPVRHKPMPVHNRKNLFPPAQQKIPFPKLNPITPLPAVTHPTPY
jgi:hypothetical protein